MKTKLNCGECVKKFLSDEKVDDQYFQEINRGGLSVPTNLCFQLGKLALPVMERLISSKYESSFILCNNQRKVFSHLLRESLFLIQDHYSDDEKCFSCGTPVENNFHIPFKTFGNILLNNYSKLKNNMLASLRNEEKLPDKRDLKSSTTRKLSTLKK